MRLAPWIALVAALPLAAVAADIRISVGGEISPGVYGRVDIGQAPPPPVFYPAPVLIVKPAPTVVVAQPVYLHVPPGHAKNWRKHCRQYDACGVPVYFVRSAEYEPGYKSKGKERGHGKGKDD